MDSVIRIRGRGRSGQIPITGWGGGGIMDITGVFCVDGL